MHSIVINQFREWLISEFFLMNFDSILIPVDVKVPCAAKSQTRTRRGQISKTKMRVGFYVLRSRIFEDNPTLFICSISSSLTLFLTVLERNSIIIRYRIKPKDHQFTKVKSKDYDKGIQRNTKMEHFASRK